MNPNQPQFPQQPQGNMPYLQMPQQTPGMPQLPGYPSQQYPPQTTQYQPGNYPQMGNLQQPALSNPQQSTGFPYPSTQPQTVFTSAGFPLQQQQPGYPNQQQQPGFPSQQPQPGFPNQQPGPGYPTQQPGPGYPTQQPGPGYPTQQPGFPSQQLPGPGYPTQPPTPGYPQQPGYPAQQFSGFPPSQQYQPQYPGQPTYASNMLTATVRPVQHFNAQFDAEILRKAMKGIGTDEGAIIGVLTQRSNAQRMEIVTSFKALYGKDLIANLKSELSGKFEDLVVALMMSTASFLAKELNEAISGLGTNEDVLVEILCTSNNSQILNIKSAYQQMFNRSLESDLSQDTSGNFRRILVSLCQGRRDESLAVNEQAAVFDAQSLMKAGELRIGTDESVFNSILCTRSYNQLRRVFQLYQQLSGSPFEKAISNEFSGNIKDGLLAIVKSVNDKAGFFAERLHDALAGFGTKDRTLIRVIVTRCEIDMGDIKKAYQLRYGSSLDADISNDTSGDYKRALLALVTG